MCCEPRAAVCIWSCVLAVQPFTRPVDNAAADLFFWMGSSHGSTPVARLPQTLDGVIPEFFVINCHVLDTHPTGHSAPWQDVNRIMLGTRSSQTGHKLFSSTKKSQASSLLQGLLCDHVLRKLHLTASLSVKATTLWPCQTRNISISCITFDWSFSLTRSRNSLSSSSLQKARARPLLSYRAPPSREYPLSSKDASTYMWMWSDNDPTIRLGTLAWVWSRMHSSAKMVSGHYRCLEGCRLTKRGCHFWRPFQTTGHRWNCRRPLSLSTSARCSTPQAFTKFRDRGVRVANERKPISRHSEIELNPQIFADSA